MLGTLRLWAEVFKVSPDGQGYMWEKLSNGLILTKIISEFMTDEQCIHILAKNVDQQYILDVILSPQTSELKQTSDCFVYWKDQKTHVVWGLNFSSSYDSQKFMEKFEHCKKLNRPHHNINHLHKHVSLNDFGGKFKSTAQDVKYKSEANFAENDHKFVKLSYSSDIMTKKDAKTIELHSHDKCQLACNNNLKSSHYVPLSRSKTLNLNQTIFTNTAYTNMKPCVHSKEYKSDGEDNLSVIFSTLNPPPVKSYSNEKLLMPQNMNSRYYSKSFNNQHIPLFDLTHISGTSDVKHLASSKSQSFVKYEHADKNNLYNYNMFYEFDHKKDNGFREYTFGDSPVKHKSEETYFSAKILSEDADFNRENSISLKTDQSSNVTDTSIYNYKLRKFKNHDEIANSSNFALASNNKCLNTSSDFNQKEIPIPRKNDYRRSQSHHYISKSATMPSTSQQMPASKPNLEMNKGSNITQFSPYGYWSRAIRKTGWLNVKHWLTNKKNKLDLASKRSWKKYWVCLKGPTLLFYATSDQENSQAKKVLHHMLIIEGAIVQAVPEHPKKENLFCLSINSGDVLMFQAGSYPELENWISAIHISCAASLARHHGKENIIKILTHEIFKLNYNIEMDTRMKNMGEAQLTIVSDSNNRQAILKQIKKWEFRIEEMALEKYRYQSYKASLLNSELPNPKSLMVYSSKSMKSYLSKMNISNTVSSFHAHVSIRMQSYNCSTNDYNRKLGAYFSTSTTFMDAKSNESNSDVEKNLKRIMSPGSSKAHFKNSLSNHISQSHHNIKEYLSQPNTPTNGPKNSKKSVENLMNSCVNSLLDSNVDENVIVTPNGTVNFEDKVIKINLPRNEKLVMSLNERMTIEDLLLTVCYKIRYNPSEYFFKFKHASPNGKYTVPDLHTYVHENSIIGIDLCPKSVFNVELLRSSTMQKFGFSIQAEICSKIHKPDELVVYIAEVNKDSIGYQKGLSNGDEILSINKKSVADLDMMFVENFLQQSSKVLLLIRSCQIEPPKRDGEKNFLKDLKEKINEKSAQRLNKRSSLQKLNSHSVFYDKDVEGEEERTKDIASNRVTNQVKIWEAITSSSSNDIISKQQTQYVTKKENCEHKMENTKLNIKTSSSNIDTNIPLQNFLFLLSDFVKSEKAYITNINFIKENYIAPIRNHFLNNEDILNLIKTVEEIIMFQESLIKNIVEISQITEETASPYSINEAMLSAVAETLIRCSPYFKLYSTLYSCYYKAQKILKSNEAAGIVTKDEDINRMKTYNQHVYFEYFLSSVLNRMPEYPIIIKQLLTHSKENSVDQKKLNCSIKTIELIMEHINGMQRIQNEFGNIFNKLVQDYVIIRSKPKTNISGNDSDDKDNKLKYNLRDSKSSINLSIGDLLLCDHVDWFNIPGELGSSKKSYSVLPCILFIFKTAIILLSIDPIKFREIKQQNANIYKKISLPEECITHKILIPSNRILKLATLASEYEALYFWDLHYSEGENVIKDAHGFDKNLRLSTRSKQLRQRFLDTIRQIKSHNLSGSKSCDDILKLKLYYDKFNNDLQKFTTPHPIERGISFQTPKPNDLNNVSMQEGSSVTYNFLNRNSTSSFTNHDRTIKSLDYSSTINKSASRGASLSYSSISVLSILPNTETSITVTSTMVDISKSYSCNNFSNAKIDPSIAMMNNLTISSVNNLPNAITRSQSPIWKPLQFDNHYHSFI
ncbi:rho guanine nucleotide exchange factor TIAM1-like isoform X2 [Gordionus sp. m RMFG-2023]|uniref:rho guanine nucleotide exchange factor TIAM1-like isoform X2 n=1 Tax=Gordionus sp. m RMFG-2023 TaxID=3053472 RepID=UPI0031FD989D